MNSCLDLGVLHQYPKQVLSVEEILEKQLNTMIQLVGFSWLFTISMIVLSQWLPKQTSP